MITDTLCVVAFVLSAVSLLVSLMNIRPRQRRMGDLLDLCHHCGRPRRT